MALFLIPSLMSGSDGTEITYSDFIDRVDSSEVESIDVETTTGKITGELTDGTKFVTHGGGDRGLSEVDEALVDERGVKKQFHAPSSNWLLNLLGLFLPILLIIGFFVWMQRHIGNGFFRLDNRNNGHHS